MKLFVSVVALIVVMCGGGGSGITTEVIEYEYDGTTFTGYLASPGGGLATRPGVLVVHEWWGLNDYAKSRAEKLATELRCVAFAVDMYGDGAVAETAEDAGKMAGVVRGDYELMRGRINAGLDALKAYEFVDPERIAVIGYCFGGTVALELARSGADIDGVVSFHGGLATSAPASEGDIKAKVLVLHGADDPHVSAEEIAGFQDEMRDAGVDWQMVYYSDAVHAFTNPASGDDPSLGVAYNAEADSDSWMAMLIFFDKIFSLFTAGE